MTDGLSRTWSQALQHSTRAALSAGCLLALFASIAIGCEQNQGIDLAVDNAPVICFDFCEAEYDCAWGHGEELQDAKSYLENQCVINCAYHTEKGALFIKRSLECHDRLVDGNDCISYEEREEPAARVRGEVVQDYLECLWNAGLFQCVDVSFSLEIDSEEACGQYRDCIGLLEYPFFDAPTWNSDYEMCDVPRQNDGDTWYYLDVLL